jgi:Cu2+-exporting ATPase
MVNDASRSRAPIQKQAIVAKYFVPIVVGVAVLLFFIWEIWSNQCVDLWFY